MFWRVTGLAQVSPVELILNKSDFTLEELLEEEELIQECKSLNGRLINFLKQRAVVEKLIGYIVGDDESDGNDGENASDALKTEDASSKDELAGSDAAADADADADDAETPAAEGSSTEAASSADLSGGGTDDEVGDDGDAVSSARVTSRHFKYPFLACEIFCCEVDSIFATIIENQDLLEKLFRFLDRPSPRADEAAASTDAAEAARVPDAEGDAQSPRKLDILLAGYFSRVAGCFILRYMPEFMQFLKANLGIIDNLVRKIENTSIAEVLMRLVGADEQTITYHAECVQWLDETTLLPQLLARVSSYGESQYSDREAINASEVLVAISRTAPSSLSTSLSSPASVQTLLEAVNCDGSVCLTSALTVILSVLDPRRSCTAMQGAGPMSHSMLPSPPGMSAQQQQQQQQQQRQAALVMVEAIEDLFVGLIGKLVSFLDVGGDSTDASSAVMEMSYGSLCPPFGQMRLRIVEVLSMLFRTGGDKSLAALIAADALPVLMHLFRRYPFNNFLHSEVEYILCSILDQNNAALVSHLMDDVKILAVLAELPTAVESTKTGSQKTISWSAGYNGHVTRICNEIINVAGENAVVAKAAEESVSWRSFVADVLSVRNATEDVQKWNCGRPARLEDNYIESDDDDMQQLNFSDSLHGNASALGDGDGDAGGDGAKGGGIGVLAGVLQGRYDSFDDDGANVDEPELSEMLDTIDNDDDDVYFAHNGGDGGAANTGAAGVGDGAGGFETGGPFGGTFAQFASFNDDATGDDVVVVEGDEVVDAQFGAAEKAGDAEEEEDSTTGGGGGGGGASGVGLSSTPAVSYMETLVRGMQGASLGGGGGPNEDADDGGDDKEAAEFNTFNYWKPTYEVDIPEDA